MDRKDGSLAVSAPRVLIVAGTDSSGGAGIVRDVETVTAFELKASVAVTAVTAQSDRRVTAVLPMEPRLVAAQMEAALEDGEVRAVKIGMLANAGIVAAVADVLELHPDLPVVLDPVLASTSGKALLEPEGVRLMIQRLLSSATLVTPNLPELALLTGLPATGLDTGTATERLLMLGVRAALIKGGHADDVVHAPALSSNVGICSDLLVRPRHAAKAFETPRHPGTLRGTGCMLASAIGCGLAEGQSLEASVRAAKDYVSAVFVREATVGAR